MDSCVRTFSAILEKSGMDFILEERRCQIEKGYTPEHDQRWKRWELRRAADNYLEAPFHRLRRPIRMRNRKWPWFFDKWTPSPDDRIRELSIGGALMLAEAERKEFLGFKATQARAKVKSIATRIDRDLRY